MGDDRRWHGWPQVFPVGNCGQQWLFFWSFGRMLDGIRESVDQLRQRALGTIKGVLDPALVAKAQAMLGVSGETVEGAATGPQTGAAVDASGMVLKDASGSPQPEPWTPTRIAMLTVKIFFALVFASFAANELIFEPKSIRVLVFLLVLWLISSVDIMWILLLLVYLVRAMWVKYYNRRFEVKLPRPTDESTEAEKTAYQAELNRYKLNRKNYIPRIFAFLPLTTVEGATMASRFFKYPFYYPKTDNEAQWLKVEQQQYENDLKGSMFNWDGMLAIGKIKAEVEEFHKELTELNRRVAKSVANPESESTSTSAEKQVTVTTGEKSTQQGAVPVALAEGQSLNVANPMGQPTQASLRPRNPLRGSKTATQPISEKPDNTGIEMPAPGPAPESKDGE